MRSRQKDNRPSPVTAAGAQLRRVRYRVASSLDGYIAGPNGEIDWIIHDPSVNFASLYEGVDAVLLGRRTFELTQKPGAPPWPDGWDVYVFSRTLPQKSYPNVTIIRDDAGGLVATMRSRPGAHMWLFGGGDLFASLLAANVVDEVEVAVMPVLLGGYQPGDGEPWFGFERVRPLDGLPPEIALIPLIGHTFGHAGVDHAGGLDDFPGATVHMLASEREAAVAQKTWLDRQRFRPQQWSTRDRWQVWHSAIGP
jgi:dihydrofolate reductase